MSIKQRRPLLVYLDQNAISQLFKAVTRPEREIPNANDWRELHKLLFDGARDGTIAVPLTNVHAEECARGKDVLFGTALWSFAWDLSGGLMFLPKWMARWRETFPALVEYMKTVVEGFPSMSLRESGVFNMPLDKRRPKINVPPLALSDRRSPELDEAQARHLKAKAEEWRKVGLKSLSEERKLEHTEAEIGLLGLFAAYRLGIMETFPGVEWLLRTWQFFENNRTLDEATIWWMLEGFLMSKPYQRVPSVRLEANIWALHRKRIVDGGEEAALNDFNDVEFLHRVVPHVDFVLTEVGFAGLFRQREMKLDEIAPSVRVLPIRDIAKMVDELKARLPQQ